MPFSNTAANPSDKVTIKAGSNNGVNMLSFDEGDNDPNFYFEANYAGAGDAGNWLTLKDWNDHELMTWRGDGNVGVGTDDPKTAFHINGDQVGLVGDFNAGQLIIQNPGINVNGNTVVAGYTSDLNGDPVYQSWYIGGSSSSNRDVVVLNRANAKLLLGTNNSINITMLPNGNVGLGGAIMPTSKLQVPGLLEYTDNAAALTGGLTDGAFYRSGDLLKVVH
jgi:hypothetical protein